MAKPGRYRHLFCDCDSKSVIHSGTNALPESQLDRFLIRLTLGFPDRAAELQLLQQDQQSRQQQQLPALLNTDRFACLAATDPTNHYNRRRAWLYSGLSASKPHRTDMLPLSPRAARGLVRAAKAYAFLQQRQFVTTEMCRRYLLPLLNTDYNPGQQQHQADLSLLLLQETPCKCEAPFDRSF